MCYSECLRLDKLRFLATRRTEACHPVNTSDVCSSTELEVIMRRNTLNYGWQKFVSDVCEGSCNIYVFKV